MPHRNLFLDLVMVICMIKIIHCTIRYNPKGPSRQQKIANCILTISKTNFEMYGFLGISSSFNMTSPTAEIEKYVIEKLHASNTWPIEIITDDDDKPKLDRKETIDPNNTIPSDQDFASKRKNSYYVLIFDTWNRYKLQMIDVFESKSFNPSANYLVYIHNVQTTAHAQLILEHLWHNQCINSVLLAPTLRNDSVSVYSLEVFNPAKICGTNITCTRIATCTDGKLISKSKYVFNDKVPNDSRGCVIRAIAMQWPPFVIDVNATKDPGMEVYVLKAIGDYFNFTVNFTQSKQPWGERVNGTWTGLFSKIQKQEAMVAIGNIFSNQQIYEDFYISVPYYSACVIWYVPIAELVPRWRSIAAIFKYSVWISLICTIIASAISWYCLAKNNSEDVGFRNVGICVLNAVCVVFGIANPSRPFSYMIRVIFLLVSVYGLHINAFYQASLIGILTNPPHEHQISNMDELVKSPLKIAGIQRFHSFYNESNETVSEYIFNNYETSGNYTPKYYLHRVTQTKKFATMANKFFFDFYVARGDQSVCDSSHCPAVYGFNSNVVCYTINMVATRGFPYMARINNLLLIFRENGVLDKWMKDIQNSLRRESGQRGGTEDNTVILTLGHLQSAFAFLILGISFSSIIFIVEILTTFEQVSNYIQHGSQIKMKMKNKIQKIFVCRKVKKSKFKKNHKEMNSTSTVAS